MPLAEGDGGAGGNDEVDAADADQNVKIIVRSTGTVTYVGKDIAYHLWKFGLLGRDFYYRPFYHASIRARGVDPVTRDRWRTRCAGIWKGLERL